MERRENIVLRYSGTRRKGDRGGRDRCPGRNTPGTGYQEGETGKSHLRTDRFRSYNGLVSYGFKHRRIDHGKRFANGKVYINGIEGFWSFAKERLLKYHGGDAEKFPLYLKELEFRYNHRDRDLFDAIIQVLAGYSLVAYTE